MGVHLRQPKVFKLIHHQGTEHVHGQLYVDTSTLHASGTKPLDRSTPCTHNEIRPELFFFFMVATWLGLG